MRIPLGTFGAYPHEATCDLTMNVRPSSSRNTTIDGRVYNYSLRRKFSGIHRL